uniref:Uncharacterized protein n=1 Tax=Octopus bimaculoides TaxID=37653 RepID=A0A0L8I0J6_OCTBM
MLLKQDLGIWKFSAFVKQYIPRQMPCKMSYFSYLLTRGFAIVLFIGQDFLSEK